MSDQDQQGNSSGRVERPSNGIAIGICLAGVVVAFAVAFTLHNAVQQAAGERFNHWKEEQVQVTKDSIGSCMFTIEAIRSVFEASQFVDRKEFATSVRPYLARHKAIRAVLWVPAVTDVELAELRTQAEAAGADAFTLRPYIPSGDSHDALRLPAFYFEPQVGNRYLYGLDFATHPKLAKAAAIARSSGSLSMTLPLTLPDLGTEPVVFAFCPVSKNTPNARQRAGYVVGVFRLRELLPDGNDSRIHAMAALRVTDEETAATILDIPAEEPVIVGLTKSSKVDVADHTWVISFVPTRSGVGARLILSMAAALGTFVVFALMALYQRSLVGRRFLAEALVRERTVDLEASRSQAVAAMEDSDRARKQAEEVGEELKQSEARLKTAHRMARLGTWEWDLASDEIVCSEEMIEIFGIRQDDARCSLQALVDRYVHPDDLNLFKTAVSDFKETSKLPSFEHRIVGSDGTVRWARLMPPRMSSSRKRTGQVAVGTIQDISEAKITQLKIEQYVVQMKGIAQLHEQLLSPATASERLDVIAGFAVRLLGVASCRIWIRRPMDLCDLETDENGLHPCQRGYGCLKLVAAKGNLLLEDPECVPFVASGFGCLAEVCDNYFLSNQVLRDDRITLPDDLVEQGIRSFAAYRLHDGSGTPRGAIAVYHRRELGEEDDALMVQLGETASQILLAGDAEQALRESEENLRLTFAATNDGVWDWDVAQNTCVFSDRFYTMLGFEPGDLGSRFDSLLDVVHADDRAAVEAHFEECVQGERESIMVEFRALCKDGSYIHILSRGSVVSHDANGRPVRVMGTNADISRVKEMEEEATRAREWAEHLYRVVPSAIFTIDAERKITTWNREAERLTGYTADEMIGQCCLAFAVDPCRQHCGLMSDVPKPILGEECLVMRKDGAGRIIEKNVDVLRDANGTVVGGVEVFHDVTERKHMETAERLAKEKALEAKRELEMSNQRLEEAIARAERLAAKAGMANEAKSAFLANVSHEIRTPLNGVIGMTGVLLDTSLTPEQREYAATVRTSGEALLTIINDVLDLSKIEAGKISLEASEFDLQDVLDETTELISLSAVQKELEYVTMVAPGTPYMLEGDPGRLRQILVNLAGNALKFTDHGQVVTSVGLTDRVDGVVTLRFEVRDTGIGIAEDLQGELFEAFTQVDESASRVHGGTGLGLTICKHLATLMGGEIGVISSAGEGATFWFTAQFRESAAHVRQPNLERRRILVVHRHRDARTAISLILGTWHARVEAAADPIAAGIILSRACNADNRIQLIIAESTGDTVVEVAAMVAADRALRSTPIIALVPVHQPLDPRLARYHNVYSIPQPIRFCKLRRSCIRTLGLHGYDDELGQETSHTIGASSTQLALKVLVVEDNVTNRRVAQAMLGKVGLRPDCVANGAEAVMALKNIPYDLVLMDCQMPVMDGYEATRIIRSPDGGAINHKVPIIAMTAHAMKEDRDRCLRSGMDDYITKPVDPGELARVLRKWLGEQASPESLAVKPSNVADQTTIYDQEGLLARVSGDIELAETLIEVFMDDMPRKLTEFGRALEENDMTAISGLAHALKGSAGSVGATQVQHTSFLMERACRDEDMEKLGDLIAAVRTESEAFEEEFKKTRTTGRRGDIS